jgi:hypothetical protein
VQTSLAAGVDQLVARQCLQDVPPLLPLARVPQTR